MQEKIIIVGVGEIAQIAADYFTNDSGYDVEAFAAQSQYIKEKHIDENLCGLPVIELEKLSQIYSSKTYKVFIAIGYDKLNHGRANLYFLLKNMGYKFVSYISSHAFIGSNVSIGENCFILENNVLQRNVSIGNNVFLWSGNHIGHSTMIYDHVFLSSHVAISGCCTIGEYSFLGINSCMADNINIANNCFIGGNVGIMSDTLPNELYRIPKQKSERLSTKIIFGFEDKNDKR